MNPKISIIIPAYNIEKYISATLDSVLNQTYDNLEIIIVDDGSKDNTGEVIDNYAKIDSRIKVIHKENGGVTSARLRGVSESTGEWVGFVDGDDYIEPQMYSRLMENAKKYGADISHCGYQMVFPGRVDYYHDTGELILQDKRKGLADLICGTKIEPGLCNKLYRKNLFQNLSMDTTIRINEDLLMNYWLFKSAECSVFEDVCPYHYMLRQGSAATSVINEHKLWDPYHVSEIIYNDSEDAIKPFAYRKLVRLLINGATMDPKRSPELIAPYRSHTGKELKKQLKFIVKTDWCGTKLKAMALWAAIWPWSYRFIHRVYSKVRGTDKKYELK